MKIIGCGIFINAYQLCRCSCSYTCDKQFNEFILFILA